MKPPPSSPSDLELIGQALDDEPVTDEEGREAVQRLGIDVQAWAAEIRGRLSEKPQPLPKQCPWCYELHGMHLFGCVAERTRQQLEAERAWKATRGQGFLDAARHVAIRWEQPRLGC